MKKKLLALVLVGIMCMSMLTGCVPMLYGILKEKQSTESVQIDDVPDTEEPVTEEEEEITEVAEEETEETEETEEATEEVADTGSEEVDFEVAEATLENPAKVGEWVATKTYAAEDEKYHTIYYRITGVIRGDEAQKIVDEYNSGDHFVRFDPLEHDDLEYCVVTYETYFPSDFPQSEYGIYSADINLSACNMEDSGSIENYIGLSSVWDISESPEDFFAGDTFKGGKAVFAMVKDFSDYLFYESYYDNDEEYKSYVKGE